MKKLILMVALGTMLHATTCDMRYSGSTTRQTQIANCLANEANQIATIAAQIEQDKLEVLEKINKSLEKLIRKR